MMRVTPNKVAVIRPLLLWTVVMATSLIGCTSAPPTWQAALDDFVEHEMVTKGIPNISISVIQGDEFSWSHGYSHDDYEVTGATVYRVASVSKLFTAMAVMQLVEQGQVDLDAPVTRYLPEFQPESTFDEDITIRHLLAHRSGLVREPPVGHYFDDTEPTLEATVVSLNGTRVIVEPGSMTKYSNAAVSVAGSVIEIVTGQPFAEYVAGALIEPLGMESTSFLPRPDLREALGPGYMWRYDSFSLTDAPVFELGIGPAANLYTTTDDLGQFSRMLLGIARGENPEILSPASLREMWTPQFAGPDVANGFGLGFHVAQVDGQRTIGHAGVMYGYATRVWIRPDDQIGVAVVANVDASNPVVDRVARYALSLVAGQDAMEMPRTTPADSAVARSLDGHYVSGEGAVTLTERNGTLLMDYGAERFDARMLDGMLTTDGRLGFDRIRLAVQGDSLVAGPRIFVRQPRQVPLAPPDSLQEYIGEYGWNHNVLYVYEDGGRLWTLIEWFFRYPLEHLGEDLFGFPAHGLYMHETLAFTRDDQGSIASASLEGVEFVRRNDGTDSEGGFRIEPQHPIDSLRAAASAADPPVESGMFRESDLVELISLDSTIRLDVRYANTNNFMGAGFYQQPRAFLQRPAAEALVEAHQALAAEGLGIIVYDGYRPWSVTKMFWDATPDSLRLFVANPSRGSRHNRGCAVDIGLVALDTGEVIAMPSGYDEFTARAFADYQGGTARSRHFRELLRDVMEEAGFTVYDAEWWHFDYQDWRSYPILDVPFEQLGL